MKTTNNTILLIGGSAGIGLEIAKRLADGTNRLIITGRNKDRLQRVADALPNTTAIVSDISNAGETDVLVARVRNDIPQLNVVINNAATASITPLLNLDDTSYEQVAEELHTNYLAVIRLNTKLLPLLKQQQEAAIVNVSSIVAYVPGSLATYSATKAALHSYTQSLRFELEQKHPYIKVYELLPPLVNTDFSKPIGGERGISPALVAEELIKGLENDTYEIRVAGTEDLYRLSLADPAKAFATMHSLSKQEEYA